MIGYDLDGVLITDMWVEDFEISEFLYLRMNLPRALFQPKGEYVIITGRPTTDLEMTRHWISRSLDNKPVELYHGNVDMSTAKEYKATVIQSLKLSLFVESCPTQADFLRVVCPDTKILCFPEFISENIMKHLEDLK